MQKENKVYNITPANRVGSVQEYYFSRKLKEVAEMNYKLPSVFADPVGPQHRAVKRLIHL